MSTRFHVKTNNKLSIDNIDREILRILQSDARISNVALSEQVHLTASPCFERVKRLERIGLIQGYSAQLNETMLGFGQYAHIEVSLQNTNEHVFRDFHTSVLKNPAVFECSMVAGRYDYILKVRFADNNTYRRVLEQIVRTPGVRETHTYMVIEQIKLTKELPI